MWVLIQYDWCFNEKEKFGHRYAQRGDVVKTQGEDHVNLKAAIEKPRRDLGDPSSLALRRNQRRQHPGFGLSALGETTHFCCLSHRVCGICFGSPSK